MRFRRCQIRVVSRPITVRRIKRAELAVKMQHKNNGMFDGQFPVETALVRLERISQGDLEHAKRWRHYQAESWVRGRKALFCLPDEQRHKLRNEWDSMTLPGEPHYFLDFLRTNGVSIAEVK